MTNGRVRLVTFVVLLLLVGGLPAMSKTAIADDRPSSGFDIASDPEASMLGPNATPRPPRAFVVEQLADVSVYVLVVVPMVLAGLVGPTRRRIGDVGDRWRCLLLGAPPAAA